MIEKETRHVHVTVYTETDNSFAEIDVASYPDGTLKSTIDTPSEMREVADMLHEVADEFEESRK